MYGRWNYFPQQEFNLEAWVVTHCKGFVIKKNNSGNKNFGICNPTKDESNNCCTKILVVLCFGFNRVFYVGNKIENDQTFTSHGSIEIMAIIFHIS